MIDQEDSRTLAEMEREDPFAPHDLGCRCYPHVSQRAAIEGAVQAATAEYRESLKGRPPEAELFAFEVPSPRGRFRIVGPNDLTSDEAGEFAKKLTRIVEAMFAGS